jgi:hypothetical protein
MKMNRLQLEDVVEVTAETSLFSKFRYIDNWTRRRLVETFWGLIYY